MISGNKITWRSFNYYPFIEGSWIYWGFSLHFHSLQWSNEKFKIIAMKTMKAMKLGDKKNWPFWVKSHNFFQKWPVPWSFIAFFMHSFFNIFQFQAEFSSEKVEILECDTKLAWNLKSDTQDFLLHFLVNFFHKISNFRQKIMNFNQKFSLFSLHTFHCNEFSL